MRDYRSRADLRDAATEFTAAYAWSRRHSELSEQCLLVYGDHGPQISVVVRDHFPDNAKAELRNAAREVSRHLDLAYNARPARVRMQTMRRLRDQITDQDGRGFYG